MSETTQLDTNTNKQQDNQVLSLATQIISAYVSNNSISAADLPAFMASVYQNLSRLNKSGAVAEARPEPAVPVRRSILPECIICLEDGKKLKMLKRHLKTAYNMTPDQYRERWGLPADYPMVAPNYAKQRSKLAKEIGLGTGRKGAKKAA